MPRGRPKKHQSIADLQKLLSEQRQRKGKLHAERKRLQGKMDQIDREIAMLDGGPMSEGGNGTRSRARNAKKLPDVIADVLKKGGKPMKVAAITDAVRGTGYHSSSANFRGIVNQALIKDERFMSESRGMYQLQGA